MLQKHNYIYRWPFREIKISKCKKYFFNNHFQWTKSGKIKNNIISNRLCNGIPCRLQLIKYIVANVQIQETLTFSVSCITSQAQAYCWIYLENFWAGNIIILYPTQQSENIYPEKLHRNTIFSPLYHLDPNPQHNTASQINMKLFIPFT